MNDCQSLHVAESLAKERNHDEHSAEAAEPVIVAGLPVARSGAAERLPLESIAEATGCATAEGATREDQLADLIQCLAQKVKDLVLHNLDSFMFQIKFYKLHFDTISNKLLISFLGSIYRKGVSVF